MNAQIIQRVKQFRQKNQQSRAKVQQRINSTQMVTMLFAQQNVIKMLKSMHKQLNALFNTIKKKKNLQKRLPPKHLQSVKDHLRCSLSRQVVNNENMQRTIIIGAILKQEMFGISQIDYSMEIAKTYIQKMSLSQLATNISIIAAYTTQHIASPSLLYMVILSYLLRTSHKFTKQLKDQILLKRKTLFPFSKSSYQYYITDILGLSVPYFKNIDTPHLQIKQIQIILDSIYKQQKSNEGVIKKINDQLNTIKTNTQIIQKYKPKQDDDQFFDQRLQNFKGQIIKYNQAKNKGKQYVQDILKKQLTQLMALKNVIPSQFVGKVFGTVQRNKIGKIVSQRQALLKIKIAQQMCQNYMQSFLNDNSADMQSQEFRTILGQTSTNVGKKIINIMTDRYILKLKTMNKLQAIYLELRKLSLGKVQITVSQLQFNSQLNQIMMELTQYVNQYFHTSIQKVYDLIYQTQQNAIQLSNKNQLKSSVDSIKNDMKSAITLFNSLSSQNKDQIGTLQKFIQSQKMYYDQTQLSVINKVGEQMQKYLNNAQQTNKLFLNDISNLVNQFKDSNKQFFSQIKQFAINVKDLVTNYNNVIVNIQTIKQGQNSIKQGQNSMQNNFKTMQSTISSKLGQLQQQIVKRNQLQKYQNNQISKVIDKTKNDIKGANQQLSDVIKNTVDQLKNKIPQQVKKNVNILIEQYSSMVGNQRKNALQQLKNILIQFKNGGKQLKNMMQGEIISQRSNLASFTQSLRNNSINQVQSLNQWMQSRINQNKSKIGQLNTFYSNLLNQASQLGKKSIQSAIYSINTQIKDRINIDSIKNVGQTLKIIENLQFKDSKTKQTLKDIPNILIKINQVMSKFQKHENNITSIVNQIKKMKNNQFQTLLDTSFQHPMQNILKQINSIKSMIHKNSQQQKGISAYGNAKQPYDKTINDFLKLTLKSLAQYALLFDALTVNKYNYASQIIQYIQQQVNIPQNRIDNIKEIFNTNIYQQVEAVGEYIKKQFQKFSQYMPDKGKREKSEIQYDQYFNDKKKVKRNTQSLYKFLQINSID